MRDTSNHMLEIVDAFKDNDLCFVIIKLNLDGEILQLKFGIEPSDYAYVKRILEFRPFENTGVGPYRYFFAKSYSKDSIETLANASIGNFTQTDPFISLQIDPSLSHAFFVES